MLIDLRNKILFVNVSEEILMKMSHKETTKCVISQIISYPAPLKNPDS